MSAKTTGLFFGLLLMTHAAMRLPEIWRDMMRGRIDIAELLRARFDLLSGAMLFLVGSALP